jgi:integrase
MPPTLLQSLESHLLKADLTGESERWYRCVAAVFVRWHGGDGELVAETISRFLKAKQEAGCSSHYCKSLRNGLLAVMRETVDGRHVRTVKAVRLDPHSWTTGDLKTLVEALGVLAPHKRAFYRGVVLAGYHTGLAMCDLARLTRADFQAEGTLLYRRRKTGSEVVVWLPPALLAELPPEGPLFPRRWSGEQFRKDFRRIVRAAGLVGTFKTLRKTSGTQAELLTGRGHEHLANSRKVFEAHYLDRRLVHREPIRLPEPRPPEIG